MKVVMTLDTSIQCPHCKKLIGDVVVQGEIMADKFFCNGKVECPRLGCGKLIEYLSIKVDKTR